jgi:hypothetical protein
MHQKVVILPPFLFRVVTCEQRFKVAAGRFSLIGGATRSLVGSAPPHIG